MNTYTNTQSALTTKQLVFSAVLTLAALLSAAMFAAPAHAETVTANTTVTATAATGTISGTAFNDANHNKVQDNGETGLAGLMVWLRLGGHGKQVVASTTTDSLGHYVFNNLSLGTYFVTEKVKGFFHFGHAKKTTKVTLTASTTAATVNFADVVASSTKKHMDNDDRDASSTDKGERGGGHAKGKLEIHLPNIKADIHAFLGGENGKHGDDRDGDND